MSDEPQQGAPIKPAQTAEPQVTPVADPITIVAPAIEVVEPPQVAEEISDTAQLPVIEVTTPTQVEEVSVEPQPATQSTQTPEMLPEAVAPIAHNAPVLSQPDNSPAPISVLRPQAQVARTNRIQKKLDKIMEFIREKKTIRNDVEKILHVSDSTAQRYLGALVKQGKLRKLGSRGSTHYELVNI